VEIGWLNPERPDERELAGAVAVLEAARLVDSPHQLGETIDTLVAGLKFGWDGDPAQAAVALTPDGRVGGVLRVTTPSWDNRHLVVVDVAVDPVLRRQGWGSELFAAGVERGRSQGRTLVVADSWDSVPGIEFAKAMGLDRASEEVKRSLDVLAVDRGRLAALAESARNHGRRYDVVQVAVPTPTELLAEIAEMTAAINDAPIDDLDIEDEVFPPERIRAFEAAQTARGLRVYRLVARERHTGALAGHTVVAVDRQRPWHAFQFDTSVLRTHRGFRLGTMLKIAMLTLLSRAEPQLRTLDTWNAASNAHMIGINAALGFRVVQHSIDWQLHL
jgi:GNAT superfamily N-acetyltransferase